MQSTPERYWQGTILVALICNATFERYLQSTLVALICLATLARLEGSGTGCLQRRNPRTLVLHGVVTFFARCRLF